MSKTNKPTLVIVDTRLLAFQTFYKKKSILNTIGIIADELYRNKIFPDKIVFAWDNKKGSKKRKELYPEYKANRKKTLKEKDKERLDKFNKDFNKLKNVFKYLGSVIDLDGYEADDIANVLVSMLYKKANIILLSSDSDWGVNLKYDNVKQLSIHKGLMDYNKYKKEYGIPPEKVLVAQSFIGVEKENVKGIFRLGKERAYDTIINNTPEETIKIFQSMIDEGKYGTRLPVEFDTVEDMYNFNYELLRDIVKEDLSEEEYKKLVDSFKENYEITSDDFMFKTLEIFNTPYILDEKEKKIYKMSWHYTKIKRKEFNDKKGIKWNWLCNYKQ